MDLCELLLRGGQIWCAERLPPHSRRKDGYSASGAVPPPSPLPPPLLQAPLPLQALGARPLPALPPMSTSKQAEPLDPFRSVFGWIGRGT